MVDIQRPGYARKKRLLRTLYGALLVIFLLAATWAFSRLEPALSQCGTASVVVGEVERGSLVIEVRGERHAGPGRDPLDCGFYGRPDGADPGLGGVLCPC